MTKEQRFPVGGQRQPVFNFIMRHGFVMSQWSDKHWIRADGLSLVVYGTGSKARITSKDGVVADDTIEAAIAKVQS